MQKLDDKEEKKIIEPARTSSRTLADTKTDAPHPRSNTRSIPLSDHEGKLKVFTTFSIMALVNLSTWLFSSTSNETDNYEINHLALDLALAFWLFHRLEPKEPLSAHQQIPVDSIPKLLTEPSAPPDAKSFSSDEQRDNRLEIHKTSTARPISPLDIKRDTGLLIGTNITPFLSSIPHDERVFLSGGQRDDLWEMRELSITRWIFDKDYKTKLPKNEAKLYILNNQLRDKYFYDLSERQKIFRQFQTAARQNSPQAQFNLGDCYRFGIVVKEDTKQALYWYRLAAEQGLPSAQVVLGYAYKRGIGVEQDAKQAVHWYHLAAEQGSASAQCNLGNCYQSGTGVEKDAKQAMGWYHKAAEQGLARAQLKLGNCYRDGIGTKKNFIAAKKYYFLAAKQGIQIAKKYAEQLAYFTAPGIKHKNWKQFLQQLHTPVERKTAKSPETNSDYLSMKWYKDAQAGNPVGQYILGCCYEEGIGVNKDAKEASRWYHLAAKQGLPEAQNNLGNYFYNKLGINKNFQLFTLMMRDADLKKRNGPQPNLNNCHQCKNKLDLEKDAQEAVDYYRLAANKGYAHGQNNLGYCYDYGIGVEQDAKQAVHWYQLAAAQGLAEAQNNLGNCYRYGMGVEQDIKKALPYYAEAAVQELAEAQANLGDCYFRYLVSASQQNLFLAERFYRLAAEQRIASAQDQLSLILFGSVIFMDELEKRFTDTVRYAYLAAKQGYPRAQVRLGIYYADGVDISTADFKMSGNYVLEPNIEEAKKWWREAASYDIAFLNQYSAWDKLNVYSESTSKKTITSLAESLAKETAFLPLVIQRTIMDYLTDRENILETTSLSLKRRPQSMSWQQQMYSFFQNNIPTLKSLTTTSKPEAEPTTTKPDEEATTTNTNPPSPNG